MSFFRKSRRQGEVPATDPQIPAGDGGDGGKPRKAKQPKPKIHKLRMLIVILGICVLAGVAWVFGVMTAVASNLGELEVRSKNEVAHNSIVLDTNGTQIATLTNNEGRIYVESDQIAQSMKEATVAIEDRRFYEHRGVDYVGIARALYQDVLSRSAEQGASTITQQFVKGHLDAQERRTILQKLVEASYAYQLERKWDKDKILTEYLNSIYFGEGAYGIEAAAHTYFSWNHPGCGTEGQPTCASQLLPYESAFLAGMIQNPSNYSPRIDPKVTKERRDTVLRAMFRSGYITEAELNEYLATSIPRVSDLSLPEEDSQVPYFTSWLRQQLVDKYGAATAFGGGLVVKSTIDLELQRAAEQVIQNQLGGLPITASVVVLQNDNAAVRAMVGGFNYTQAPFNLATQGQRQPGSAFKPFTLVTALNNGISPDRTFVSRPVEFGFKNKGVKEIFKVNNYNDSYLGTVSLATATTYSDNSVYAQVGMELGTKKVAATAKKLGIRSEISKNPAMLLGGLERGVNPLEMAHAYVSLAQHGKRVTGTLAASPNGPVAIERVENERGKPVTTQDGLRGVNQRLTEQVVPPGVADTATTILRSVVTSGTGKNAQTGELTWGKTGTTDDNGDAWFVGATEDITIAVWVGHADSVTPMLTEYGGKPVDGGTFPAQIFHDIVLAWLAIMEDRQIEAGDFDGDGVPDDEADGDTTDPFGTGEGNGAPPEGNTAPAPVDDTPAPQQQQQAPPAGNGGGGGNRGNAGGGTGGGTGGGSAGGGSL